MAKSAGLAAIAKLAATVGTYGRARAALGAVADTVSTAYAKLPEVSDVAGIRDAFKARLDRLNESAQRYYATFNVDSPDLLDQEISTQNAMRVGWALSTAQELFDDINAEAGVTYFDFVQILTAALEQAGTWVGQGVNAVLKPIAGAGAAIVKQIWPWLLLAAAILAVYLFRRRIARRIGAAAA